MTTRQEILLRLAALQGGMSVDEVCDKISKEIMILLYGMTYFHM